MAQAQAAERYDYGALGTGASVMVSPCAYGTCMRGDLPSLTSTSTRISLAQASASSAPLHRLGSMGLPPPSGP